MALTVCGACVVSVAAPAFAASPETPETTAATSVTASSAVLHGVLNPHSEAVAGYDFTFGANPACEGGPTEAVAEALVKELPVEAAVSGLEPAREYTFCLLATNLVGEVPGSSAGAPVSFQTLALPPAVDSEAASAVGSTTATLEAQVNPNNEATSFKFEYATGEDLKGATVVAGAEPLPAEYGDRTATVPALSGLVPRTTYFYRVVAENAQSETEATPAVGATQSFTTQDLPVLTAGPAQAIGRTQATLSGTVNPGGLATTYHYVYVEAAKYNPGAGECAEGQACAYAAGLSTPATAIGPDFEAHTAGPVQITELKPGTSYDYALVASNLLGSEVGANGQFTTLPATPPAASTGAATGISQTSATINASVDTRGLPTTIRFELLPAGTPVGAGALIPATLGEHSGNTVQASVAFNQELQPGATYGYRVLAANADGTAQGQVVSFTTASFPAPAGFTLNPSFPTLSFTPIAALEAKTPPAKPLTNKQKLKKALAACHKHKKKTKRHSCESQAHKRYAPAKKRTK